MSDLDEKELIDIVEDADITLPEEEPVDIPEESIFISMIETRLRGIENTVKKLVDDVTIDTMLGTNGFPYIRFDIEGNEINMSYLPVGDPEENSFILLVRSIVYAPDEPDGGLALLCESFNMSSPFGFAVYDPIDGSIELRAQIPEYGGISGDRQYGHILDLFLYGIEELKDTISEE